MNIEDYEFEEMWKKGADKRRAKNDVEIFTERLPKELLRLDKVAKAFGKVKLNDRGLPW